MKKKLILFGLLLSAVIITGLKIIPDTEKETNPLPPAVSRPNVFLIGALQMEGDADYNLKCGELKFNIWHNYIAIVDTMNINGKHRPVPNGWYTFKGAGCNKDSLLLPASEYATAISSIININKNNGYWSFMERPKFEYLIRGQRILCDVCGTEQNNS